MTVPLALLQKNAIQFNPPLSEKKIKAINSLGAGVIEKVSKFRSYFRSFSWKYSLLWPCCFYGAFLHFSSQKSSVRCLLFVILEKGLGKEAQKKHFADLLTFFYFYTTSEIQWK